MTYCSETRDTNNVVRERVNVCIIPSCCIREYRDDDALSRFYIQEMMFLSPADEGEGMGLKICLFIVTANNSVVLRTGRACQGTGPRSSLQMDFQPNMKYTKQNPMDRREISLY